MTSTQTHIYIETRAADATCTIDFALGKCQTERIVPTQQCHRPSTVKHQQGPHCRDKTHAISETSSMYLHTVCAHEDFPNGYLPTWRSRRRAWYLHVEGDDENCNTHSQVYVFVRTTNPPTDLQNFRSFALRRNQIHNHLSVPFRCPQGLYRRISANLAITQVNLTPSRQGKR